MAITTTLAGELETLSAFVGSELDRLNRLSGGTAALDLSPIASRLAALESALRASTTTGSTQVDEVAAALAILQAQIATATTTSVRSASPIAVDSLAALPVPSLLIDLDHDATLADLVARYRDAATEAGMPELGDYIGLESTPERRLLQIVAYWIVWLSHRINAMYRARLLYFGRGSDADHNADAYGVDRLEGETDLELIRRTRIRNRGSSAAGPDDWWRFHAMTADASVADVAVTRNHFPYPRPGQNRGDVTISILADTADGVPTAATLDRVREALTRRDVRPVNAMPIIRAATQRAVTVAADVYLLPTATPATFAAIEPHFRAAWAAHLALGWDVARSWVEKHLMVAGVQRVELIGWLDVKMPPHEAPRLDTVSLVLRGRDY